MSSGSYWPISALRGYVPLAWHRIQLQKPFEYPLGCRKVIRDTSLRDLPWKHQPTGGFEDLIAKLQEAQSPQRLIALQNAAGRMHETVSGR